MPAVKLDEIWLHHHAHGVFPVVLIVEADAPVPSHRLQHRSEKDSAGGYLFKKYPLPYVRAGGKGVLHCHILHKKLPEPFRIRLRPSIYIIGTVPSRTVDLDFQPVSLENMLPPVSERLPVEGFVRPWVESGVSPQFLYFVKSPRAIKQLEEPDISVFGGVVHVV